ncbi:chorismate-binding protein [Formosa sp. S-31]|uniref:chorismate-binding protein n=1 Tax=Formosa sp. S-31 TaxID=2790949 RepID=UPI003EC08627
MQEDIFRYIKQQYTKDLPFVIYRKPQTNIVKAVCQNDDNLNVSTSLSESGFVFAPFDDEGETIIFPLKDSEALKEEVSFLPETEDKQTPDTMSSEAERQHISLVEKGVAEIKSGTFQKVVLSRRETVELPDFDFVRVFKRLLARYTSAFVYCWYHPKVGLWLGATPETLLKIDGQRLVTMSLAGTQKYEGSMDVTWGEKELQEQQFVTDFITEQLEDKVLAVAASPVRTVKAGPLVHLQTQISARLKPESNLSAIVKALHPTPAVCGLPKDKAKVFILQSEHYNRSFYTGFLGELHFKDKQTRNTNRRNVENNVYGTVKTVSHLFVNLRCMQVEGNSVQVYVGGGITKDSNPKAEFLETVHKAETMKKVLF